MHGRLEAIDIWPAGLVPLLDLDRIPVIHVPEEVPAWLTPLGNVRNVEATVDPVVPRLDVIRNAAKGDHRPILKLEMRHPPEVSFRLWHISQIEVNALA